jgi:diguanylate cyclase (GGDEF)-like protein/PAS domain S-box-containing protein
MAHRTPHSTLPTEDDSTEKSSGVEPKSPVHEPSSERTPRAERAKPLGLRPLVRGPARSNRILVVDDEPQILVALEDLLSDDFLVTATDEPERALKLAEQEDIAVVLSDERMPRMMGHELFARLSERSAASRVLVTGFADLNAVVRAVNEGQIFAYVTKPWDSADLRQKVVRAAEHFQLTQALADERQLLHDLMNSVSDAIYFKDRDQRFVRVNRGFLDMFGLDTEESIVGARLSDVMPDSAVAHALEVAEQAVLLGTERRSNAEHPHPRPPNDEEAWLSTTSAALISANGDVVGLVGISRDVSDRVQAQNALRLSEERLRLAFAASNASLFDWNICTGELSLSGAGSGMLPASAQSFDVHSLEQAVHPDDRARLSETLTNHLERRLPFQALELRALTDNGTYRWFELNAQATWDSHGRATRLVGSSVDITTRKEHAAQAARLEFLASYDEVTALPNRSLLLGRLERRIASGEAAALAVLDISRLRQFNETFGRTTGDDLLREVASRLTNLVGSGDFVARLEGSSFGVLLEVEDDKRALEWLERAFAQLARPFVLHGGELHVAIAGGVAMFPTDGKSAEGLVANAGAALEAAKNHGQLYRFYAPTMNSRVAERLKLESDLRRALVRNELTLHYQPKVDLRTGQVTGLEALLRWNDPERGLVSPGEFIPVLEETGLIIEAGTWVLAEAARQYAEWMRRGHAPPRIAVNVSPLQLEQPGFVASLDAVLRQQPTARRGLDIEITESVLAGDVSGNIKKLEQARERGFKVAIDDFGTGYSSLRYLSRLPLDALKVDRSFVTTMVEDPQQTAIVTSIISLAQALRLKVIAEGVEVPMQAHLLRLLRCDEFQGYLVARPLPPEQVETMLDQRFVFDEGPLSIRR